MPTLTTPRIARLNAAEKIFVGPLSRYQNLLGAGDTPTFTGVKTCALDNQTAPHFHACVESLFIIEGKMEACVVGEPVHTCILQAVDMIALPTNTGHIFRNPGPGTLRLLGIHANPERIIHRLGEA